MPSCTCLYRGLLAALLAAALPAWAIVGGTATAGFGQVGHGVQITPNWVLTAAHAVLSPGAGYGNGFGSSLVAATFLSGAGPFPADDLALMRLVSPIAAPPLTLSADLLAPGPQPAMNVTIVSAAHQAPRGYGFSLLREVLDSVDVEGPPGTFTAVPVNWLVTYTDAGAGAPYVQGGDSGGGLFFGHVPDSITPLMGITSALIDRGSNDPPTQFSSGFVQLASYRSWIDATMLADGADDQFALWASAVPEPASWSIGLAGAALLGGVARRRQRRA